MSSIGICSVLKHIEKQLRAQDDRSILADEESVTLDASSSSSTAAPLEHLSFVVLFPQKFQL